MTYDGLGCVCILFFGCHKHSLRVRHCEVLLTAVCTESRLTQEKRIKSGFSANPLLTWDSTAENVNVNKTDILFFLPFLNFVYTGSYFVRVSDPWNLNYGQLCLSAPSSLFLSLTLQPKLNLQQSCLSLPSDRTTTEPPSPYWSRVSQQGRETRRFRQQ